MLDRLNSLAAAFAARSLREDGQALTEYALVLAVIVVGVIVALTTIGGSVAGTFSSVCQALTGGTAGC